MRKVKVLFLVVFGPDFEHRIQVSRDETRWTGWTRTFVGGHSRYPRRSENVWIVFFVHSWTSSLTRASTNPFFHFTS